MLEKILLNNNSFRMWFFDANNNKKNSNNNFTQSHKIFYFSSFQKRKVWFYKCKQKSYLTKLRKRYWRKMKIYSFVYRLEMSKRYLNRETFLFLQTKKKINLPSNLQKFSFFNFSIWVNLNYLTVHSPMHIFFLCLSRIACFFCWEIEIRAWTRARLGSSSIEL